MDDELEGQISFNDYFSKQKLDIKPKALVNFINDMGVSQYEQIGDVVRKTVEQCGDSLAGEVIERITNNVSVWLLGIGSNYEKYIEKLIHGEQ